MKVNSLRELKKLIQLCQSQGVRTIEIDGIKLELTELPKKTVKYKQIQEPAYGTGSIEEEMQIPQMEIETDMPTEEQMLFYSSDAASQQ